jgi:hypothetical protein
VGRLHSINQERRTHTKFRVENCTTIQSEKWTSLQHKIKDKIMFKLRYINYRMKNKIKKMRERIQEAPTSIYYLSQVAKISE